MSSLNYLDSITAGIFAPLLKEKLNFEPQSDKIGLSSAIFHAILTAVIGWTVFGWLFVFRYSFTRFLRGDINSPAKVYAYENNLIFMFETIGILIVLMWIFPSILQIILNRITLGKEKVQPRLSFVTHAYSTSGFAFLFFPVVIILTWLNTYNYKVIISNFGQDIIIVGFFIIICYTYLCAAFRSHQQFGVRIRYSLLHLWIPGLLILAQITIGIV
jgi:hypothetical protein